jgi:hypothetical protein
MSLQVTGSINLPLKLTRAKTGGNLSQPTDAGTFTFPNTSYASGTNAGQLEECWFGSVTIVGTNVTTIDLSDTTGAGLVMQGDAIAFTKIKEFFVYNRSSNAADIATVTFNGTNGWTAWLNGSMKIDPTTCAGFADAGGLGFAVTAGTGDKVSFVNSGTNTITLDLMIAGNKS